MSLFLGIYHRGNRIEATKVQPMIDAFGRFERRFLSQVDFPGFVFVSANELPNESSISVADECAFGLIGTLVPNSGKTLSPLANFMEAWQKNGPDCLPNLEGAFAAAVYDPGTHKLLLANDKFGTRPLFVCECGPYLAFCNELEPLLLLPDFVPKVHLDAVADYFCLGATLGGETFVKGIVNLPPATLMEVSIRSVSKVRYWNPTLSVDHASTIEEHAKRLGDTMKVIVREMADQLTNLNCLLSAGADSRLILSCLRQDQRAGIPFLTSKLSFLSANEDKDLIGAQQLALRLNLQHKILEIAFSERDFGPEYFDEVKHSKEAKILGGWHGGEFLGGFCAKAAPMQHSLTFQEVDFKLRNTFSWRIRRKLSRHPFAHYEAKKASFPTENAEFHFQIDQFCRSFFGDIYQGSRGSWLQPFELINQGFSPFWDSRFLQQLLTVPFEMIADYHLYNVIFRDCLTELTDIPSNSPLTTRADRAIPPMKDGIEPKNVLKPKYQNALHRFVNDPKTWQRRMYRRRRFRKVLQDDNAQLTLRFIDFEAWWRKFMEKSHD